MVCSTAAKSSMKVIRSCSAPTSLLYLCCARLRRLVPDCIDTLDVLPLPPGLRQLLHNKLGWVLSLNGGNTEENPDRPEPSSHSTVTPSTGPSYSESDSEGCTSDPEACKRKRCRWTWLVSSNPRVCFNTQRWQTVVSSLVERAASVRGRVKPREQNVTGKCVFLPLHLHRDFATLYLSHVSIQTFSITMYFKEKNRLLQLVWELMDRRNIHVTTASSKAKFWWSWWYIWK